MQIVQIETLLQSDQNFHILDGIHYIQSQLSEPSYPICEDYLFILSKFFMKTANYALRILVIEVLKKTSLKFISLIEDWKKIMPNFTKECYSIDQQLRIISLHAIHALVQGLDEAQDIFHLVYNLFLKSVDYSEIYISAKIIAQLALKDLEYSFILKLNVNSETEQYQYLKYELIIKILLQLQSSNLLVPKIYEFIENHYDKIIISSQQNSKSEYLSYRYNLTKLAHKYNYPSHSEKLQKQQCQQIFKYLRGQQYQKFTDLYQRNLNLPIPIQQILQDKDIIKQLLDQETIQSLNVNKIAVLFVKEFHYYKEQFLQISKSYPQLVGLINLLQDVFEISLLEKVATMNNELESMLEKAIYNIDVLIVEIYQNLNIIRNLKLKAQIQLLGLSYRIKSCIKYQCCKNIQFGFDKLVSQSLGQSLKLQVYLLKFCIRINDNNMSQIQESIMRNNKYGINLKLYVNYLNKLQNYDENQYWSDFQINSEQYQVRQEILQTYDNYSKLLNLIQSELSEKLAESIINQIFTQLNYMSDLQTKIEFYSDKIYAEDALYLQKLVLHKIQNSLFKYYLDVELDITIEQEHNLIIIKKLIQYDKIEFLRFNTTPLRKPLLYDYSQKMIQSIYHMPKFLLQIRPTPQLKLNIQKIEETAYRQVLYKIFIDIIQCRVSQDIRIVLFLQANNQIQEYNFQYELKQINHTFDVQKDIQFSYQCYAYYQEILVLISEKLEQIA
ncbi:hypothetical protein pb186bvf_010389 [Paramecium bursaria]